MTNVKEKFKLKLKLNVEALLEEIKIRRRLDSWLYMEREYISILTTIYDLDKLYDRFTINSLLSVALAIDDLTVNSFENYITEAFKRNDKNIEHTFFTSINVSITNSEPIILPSRRLDFLEEISEQSQAIALGLKGQFIKATVYANSLEEAFDTAFTDIHHELAIYNYLLPGKRILDILNITDKDTPLNKIGLSGYTCFENNAHTLFCREISNVSTTYILDSKVISDFKSKLEKINYHDDIQHALGLALDAFYETKHALVFIKLWTALEYLVTPEKANYDLLVSRCAALFLCKNTEDVNREKLRYLRYIRNEFIHRSRPLFDELSSIYILLQYFEELVNYHMVHGHEFENLNDANNYLDALPLLFKYPHSFKMET